MNAPSRSLTRRQKVEEREAAIRESARRVFIEKGYEGARMTEIAAGADIAEGTIYIYYKNKAALMRAIVSDFWQTLTNDAWDEIGAIDDPYDALSALARFHLKSVMDQNDMIGLAQTLRAHLEELGTTREELRTYVEVFDTVYRRGVDRGLLKPLEKLWMVRDIFFGTLEHSSRTLLLHNDTNYEPIADNLVELIWSQYGTGSDALRETEPPLDLTQRLEKAIEKLEGMHRNQ